MTKRYSIEEVAKMIKRDPASVRVAIKALGENKELSAETFPFAKDAWRITPTDIPKIQTYLRHISMDSRSGNARSIRKKILKRPD